MQGIRIWSLVQLRAEEAEEQMCFLQRPQVLLLFCISWQTHAQKHPWLRANAGIQVYLDAIYGTLRCDVANAIVCSRVKRKEYFFLQRRTRKLILD